ncbi:MarR family winged helix-turn-helix transcriptional regulator [Altererythrobacter sp.]|uniref:MarR family winged helix-turn-helix transcriptional regulator n=1 Tax=Altererythrobacter sp. TaxID=1872480 RepID=UPI003D054274
MIHELGYRLADNSRLLRRLFDDRVRSLGLTAAQARLLLSLHREPGKNQAFYAEKLEIEPITLTRIVDRMEDAGWVERKPDPSDRRARMVQLTTKSHNIVSQLRDKVENMFEEVLDGFSEDDRRLLGSLLDRIGSNLYAARDMELTNG